MDLHRTIELSKDRKNVNIMEGSTRPSIIRTSGIVMFLLVQIQLKVSRKSDGRRTIDRYAIIAWTPKQWWVTMMKVHYTSKQPMWSCNSYTPCTKTDDIEIRNFTRRSI